MRVTKCDICGKTYEPYNGNIHGENGFNGLLLLNFDNKGRYDKIKYLDLCPECSSKMYGTFEVTRGDVNEIQEEYE